MITVLKPNLDLQRASSIQSELASTHNIENTYNDLTDKNIRDIRSWHTQDLDSTGLLADFFGVSEEVIKKITFDKTKSELVIETEHQHQIDSGHLKTQAGEIFIPNLKPMLCSKMTDTTCSLQTNKSRKPRRAQLQKDEIIDIEKRFKKESDGDIAKRFGVAEATIRRRRLLKGIKKDRRPHKPHNRLPIAERNEYAEKLTSGKVTKEYLKGKGLSVWQINNLRKRNTKF